MGSDELCDEIFEFEDKWGHKLNLYLEHGEGYKSRTLTIADSEHFEFIITKPLARKIIKELEEEFALGVNSNQEIDDE